MGIISKWKLSRRDLDLALQWLYTTEWICTSDAKVCTRQHIIVTLYLSNGIFLLHLFRPKLNRKINAMSYADKRGQGVYYNALGSNRKIHRKQVDLILPRQVSKRSQSTPNFTFINWVQYRNPKLSWYELKFDFRTLNSNWNEQIGFSSFVGRCQWN